MENGRGGRLALLAAACGAAGAALAQTTCPFVPGERKIDFHVTPERRAVELRRHGTADSAAPHCVLQLDCTVRPEPRAMSYTLRRDSILLGDIAAVGFSFADGSRQTCKVIAR